VSTYILFGQQISFSEAQDRYSRLVSAYINALFATTTEFTTWYHACGSIEKVLQGYVSEADRLISKYVDGPLYEQLLDLEIYDVGKETYRDNCMVLEPAQTACRRFKGLIQKVNDAKDAEIEYRESRKQNRSRVVGGGFGLGGALKGMATAGAINAVTGMGHSVVNAFGNVGSSLSAASSKYSIYKDEETFNCLCAALADCLGSTFSAHIQIVNERKPHCIDVFSDSDRAEALLENAKRFPDKAQHLLLEAFKQDPASFDLLQYIFLNYRRERKNVLTIAKSFGISLSDTITSILSQEYTADAKTDESKAQAARKRILSLMDEMGLSESETLDQLEQDCLDRVVANYSANAASCDEILNRIRDYTASEKNKQAIIKKHLIWQLGAEYHVEFTPEEVEAVIAPEYTQEARASTPAAESAKKQILYKMSVMGAQQSTTLDQLESDCVARLCTNYTHADEKTCDAMLEKIRAYPAQEKIKELYLKKVQGRIEEIWSAEDGEIFDNLYLKTNIEDQSQKDAAIAYIKEKGRTSSSSKYLNAVTNCTPGNIKKAVAYVSWNLCMAISAAILIIVSAVLLVAFDADIYLCMIPILVGAALLYFRSKLKKIWNTLTIQGTIFHPQIFREHMPIGKTPVMPALQVCIVVLLAAVGVFVLVQCNAKKHIAAETPTMATAVDATSNEQQKTSSAVDMQLPTKSDTSASVSAPAYNEYTTDTQDDSFSPIYKGKSYEDVLNEVADTFPAATYALFDMTADDNPELVVKTGTSQSTARYDVYSFQDGDTQYLGSIDGAYTELCPISSYYALLAVKDNGYQATLSLIVYQNGGLTSIEAFDGYSSDMDSYESLKFSPVRKYDASQWTTNPSTMNDWLFEQFLNENWTYNMVSELSSSEVYALNYRTSMLAQFGISSLQTSRLDELLFFAAGYLAATDPTKLDLYRKEDKLIYSMSAGDATVVLIDFFGLRPDYSVLDESHGVRLSADILYFENSPESYNPYVAVISSIEEDLENRMYCNVTYDLYHVTDQSLSWYDYEPFYNMTAEEAAQNASLMKIRTINEQIFCLSEDSDRYDTCWIKSFDIVDG
jgi:hypothetical protein